MVEAAEHAKRVAQINEERRAVGCQGGCELWWSENMLTKQKRFVHRTEDDSEHLTVDDYVMMVEPRDTLLPGAVLEWLRGLHQ